MTTTTFAPAIEEKIEKIRSSISTDELEEMSRPYRLSDAIREGSLVTTQAYDWGNGENACAMSAAVMAARAHGYM